jgi:hypothetical protein
MLLEGSGNPAGKVRPRTSAWYKIYVDATSRNVILPDLPGNCENRKTRAGRKIISICSHSGSRDNIIPKANIFC